MKINCENCGKEILQATSICLDCGHNNAENNTIEKCCENCKHYEPENDIECKVLKKTLKWDRDELEIDCPDTFSCKRYSYA